MKKKLIYLVVLVLTFFCSLNYVWASSLVKEEIDDIYVFIKGPKKPWFSGQYTNYSLDGKTVYCIEPGTDITTLLYNGEEGLVNSPYDDAINKKIQLIGYYGYNYPGHQTLNYRMATQALIWEAVSGQTVEFWTEISGGGNIIRVTKERNAILELVNHHYDTPSFMDSLKDIYLGKTTIFHDDNNLLKEFEVLSMDGVTANIDGNDLKITPNRSGKVEIKLIKKTYIKDPTELFVGVDEKSQKMAYFGNYDPYILTINLNVKGGRVEVEKIDQELMLNKPQGDATLIGAVYGIYTLDDVLVDTVTIGENTKALSKELPLGNYYALELQSSKGYTLSTKKTYFNITENNLNPTITVFEVVIKRFVELHKFKTDLQSGLLIPEGDVTFTAYLKSNMEELYSLKTNKDGIATFLIPYGTFIIKQKNASKGYDIAPDIEITVTENSKDPIIRYIVNKPLKPRIKVIKLDSISKKVIKNVDFHFKIKNLDTNEYVCLGNKDCIFTTKDGYLITNEGLDYGNYQLEEIENQDFKGYAWNSEPVKFTINEDSKFVYDDNVPLLTVRFYNRPVKGNVTIYKYGEELEFKDGMFSYKKKLLNGIQYDLYAMEDIYDIEGNLIYTKDSLIGSYITKNGRININNLELGSYYIMETTTLNNYVLDTQRHEFTLEYKDQYTEKVELKLEYTNYLKKSKIKLLKVDLDTSEPLKDALLEIYNEDNKLIYQDFTNENGLIELELPYGKYYVVEKKAPKEYNLDSTRKDFELNDDNKEISLTLTNKKIDIVTEKIDIPKTRVNDYNYLSLLIILSLTLKLIFYVQKKKI